LTLVDNEKGRANVFSAPVLVFDNMNVSAVPVSGAALLLGSGLLGLAGLGRRRKAAIA